PALDPLGGAARRGLGSLVPQRQQIRRPGGELGGAIAGQLSGGGGRAILAVTAGIPTAHRQLRTVAALHLTEEILRARRQQPGIRVALIELRDVRDHALVHEPVGGRRAPQERHVVWIAGRGQYGVREQPIGEMVRHLRRPRVEAEARSVGVAIAAPVQHAAAVRPLPPVQLGIRRPLARKLRGGGGGGREQRHGALRVHAAREVAYTAGGEQSRERERLAGHVRDERRRVTQRVLAREQTGGP